MNSTQPSPQNNGPNFSNYETNELFDYIQQLEPHLIQQLSQPSPDAVNVMQSSLAQMLGGLPSEAFYTNITTNREALGQLIASAMMNGYFIRNAEQRCSMESHLGL